MVTLTEQNNLREELDALQYALKTEEDGYKYYRQSSDRTEHPVAKKFFANIAEDEIEHIRLIKEFYQSLEKSPETAKITLPAAPGEPLKKLKTIFEQAQKDIKKNIPVDTGILDVYKHAMKLETEAAEFYKKRRDLTKFEQAKKFFDWLFHFESYHYQLLSETLSYLENPEQWYQNYEKSIFEG